MLLKNFYFPAAREAPGKVYQVQDGVESIFSQRSKGQIYSIAFSPAGRLYYVSANEQTIYMEIRMFRFKRTIPVYTHSTYIRDIAFDRQGKLYFSEASGAGANGRIYRIDGATAVSFLDVPLAAVDGFWAGDFTFDSRDELYISSGNRVPAGLYRYRGGAWETVYSSTSEPIKGIDFLATDLLAYANWRSELYLLDLRNSAPELVYSNPARLWLSDIALYHAQIEELTQYEGTKIYSCDGGSIWRDDGAVSDDGIFLDLDAANAQISALLVSIGAATTSTEDDAEIWDRTRQVWEWMQAHGLGPGDPNYEAAKEYRMNLGHWPSIAEFAYMYATWGGLFWAECTCMCRAQTFATLLYRVGIPINRMAIAETRWKNSYSQHMYIVLQLDGRWYYVDPSSNAATLPATPENVGSGGPADYTHPNNLTLIPGSTLTKPMLVR